MAISTDIATWILAFVDWGILILLILIVVEVFKFFLFGGAKEEARPLELPEAWKKKVKERFKEMTSPAEEQRILAETRAAAQKARKQAEAIKGLIVRAQNAAEDALDDMQRNKMPQAERNRKKCVDAVDETLIEVRRMRRLLRETNIIKKGTDFAADMEKIRNELRKIPPATLANKQDILNKQATALGVAHTQINEIIKMIK